MPILSEVIKAIEDIAPTGLAEPWDNTGLQVGDPSAAVKKVLVALDPLPEVVDEAAGLGADLVVAHHPLFFGDMKRLDLSHGQGAVAGAAVRAGIAIYSAHTSLDRIPDGVSDALAGPLGLRGAKPLRPAPGRPGGYGLGKVGALPRKLTVGAVAERLKAAHGIEVVRVIGDPDRPVKKVGLCGGSGADLMDEALAAGADLYVTGDVKYHDALRALDLGLTVLDVGHYASELPVVSRFAGLLARSFKKKGWKVVVEASKAQAEPWSYL